MYWRRLELGLTQFEVSQRAELSERGYSHIENGRRPNPQAMTLVRVAEALELPVGDLFLRRSDD